ncbi:unnamed protein product [Ectocarpus fasciculatus]
MHAFPEELQRKFNIKNSGDAGEMIKTSNNQCLVTADIWCLCRRGGWSMLDKDSRCRATIVFAMDCIQWRWGGGNARGRSVRHLNGLS